MVHPPPLAALGRGAGGEGSSPNRTPSLRILLHIIQYPPDVNSTGLLMSQLARGLAANGHDVSILTTFPHYEKFRVWDEYRGKLFQRGTQDGLKILRLWVYASGTKQNMK